MQRLVAFTVSSERAYLGSPRYKSTILQGDHELKVKRIVANIRADKVSEASNFYRDILGLELQMDHGWIQTYGSTAQMNVQVSIASEGGSSTPVPDLSIEVDDIETAIERMAQAKITIEYGPTSEPWGVRRFFVRDPFGKLLNILAHE